MFRLLSQHKLLEELCLSPLSFPIYTLSFMFNAIYPNNCFVFVNLKH